MALVSRLGGLRRGMVHAQQSRTLLTVELPDLPYEYEALEPKISGEIMLLHHTKHHATYVAGFNSAVEQLGEAQDAKDASKVVTLTRALNFHGGGHVNHSLFWKNLCPPKEFEPPSGKLKAALEKQFGDLEGFKSKLNPVAADLQGSGWTWLGYNPKSKSLDITTTTNQDTLAKQGLKPLLGVDMWEHSYYLQYKNVKADYLKAIWAVINWREVSKRYDDAVA